MMQTLVQSVKEAAELRGSSQSAGPPELVIALGKESGVYARWEGELSAINAAVAMTVAIENLLRMTTNGLHAQSQANGTAVSREHIAKVLANAIRGELEDAMIASLEDLPPYGTSKTILKRVRKAEEA